MQLEPDLTIVANKDEDRSDLYVLNRNVEVSGKVVMEATPVREGIAAWGKKSPMYKDLLDDSSRKRNPMSRNIEFEVKLAELRLSSLRQARKVQMKKPTKLEPDLTIVANKDEDRSDLYVLNRNVEVSGKVVMEATTPVREGMAAWGKRSPLYKDLFEGSSRKHNPVLRNIEFEVKLAELRLFSLRQARKVQMKKPTMDLGEPFKPLTDEEEHAVNHALEGGSCRKVLVKHEASSIDITRDILQCLSSGVWLNDDVINLYLELLKEREKREPKRFLKCHFFNTFFYKKLISGKNGYDFKAVRRWTSQRKLGYNLIELDKIFVPVHKEVHWCLAVINVKDKKFQYLDSLGAMDRLVLRTLARYFMDEAKDKSNKQIDTTYWKQEAVDHLPLQKNGWDCGMFMLKYIDFYSRGLSLDFGQEHMEYFRRRTIKEILRLRAE